MWVGVGGWCGVDVDVAGRREGACGERSDRDVDKLVAVSVTPSRYRILRSGPIGCCGRCLQKQRELGIRMDDCR